MDPLSSAVILYESARRRSVREGIWFCAPSEDDTNHFRGWVIPPLALDDEYRIFVNGHACRHSYQPDDRPHLKDVFDRFELTSRQEYYTFCFDPPMDMEVTLIECRFRSRPNPNPVQTFFWLKASDFDTPAANMLRVIGSDSLTVFRLTGYTEYRHIVDIMRRYQPSSEKPLRLLDWGCGSARVLRYFLGNPAYDVTGVDIDTFNVDYCHRTFGRSLDVRLIDPSEMLPCGSGTFDLIYGISVFTHLSQKNEQFWLRELERVSKPGAILVLSVHGETAFFKDVNSFADYTELANTGFIDLGPCLDLRTDGVEVDEQLYRNVIHSEQYIHEQWGKYFAILDYIPAGSPGDVTAHQDYVVMIKRGPNMVSALG